MSVADFVPPASTEVPPAPETRLEGETYAAWLRDLLWTFSASTPRSVQRDIGPSELGLGCPRQIAYRLAGTPLLNMGIDPMPSLAGTAMHALLAGVFTGQQPRSRYLIEHPVTYRGVRGTADLYDRRTHTVIDFKCPKRAKIRKTLAEGIPRHYRAQLQTYAAGLIAEGETPQRAVLAYVPVDGSLADVTCWTFPVDVSEADDAIDRLATIRESLTAGSPAEVTAVPSRLCPWCPQHRPQWSGDLNVACPGEDHT